MNLLEQAKKIPHGIDVISNWLGAGGVVVPLEEAQARADVCNGNNPTGRRCPNNDKSFKPTETVALAVRKYLEVKNSLNLRVKGEKILGTCAACGCVLRLQIHEPQERVRAQMSDEEKNTLPKFCWKLK